MVAVRHWVSCVLLLTFVAGAAEKSTAIVDDVAYTKPQKLVTIESRRRLNIYCDRCLEASPDDFVIGSELVQNCGPFPNPRYSGAINAVELERGKQHGRIQARVSEQENVWFMSADQVRAAYRPLGAMPIIVLTHEASARGPAETREQRDAKNRLWIDLHDQIAAMSTRGKRLTVLNAGHYIQMDQPQVVIDSVLEVLQASRGQ